MDDSENKYRILSGISSPDDLRKTDESELGELCSEIREKLIETVSANGGHLASNLGTVELTVALHRSFDTPRDKIIWDVGHQAYTHKLLTGRYNDFSTLRKEGGISGFVRPDESEYDTFYEGHAGTSVSQAAGIAASNKIKGSKNFAVAVIGDGSFGNGLVYEAMNSAGEQGGRLIVVLNDNEMSINESVGGVARHLAVVRSKPEYYRFKANTEKLLNHIPLIGRHLAAFLFKIKTIIKSYLYKSSFFEDIGFRYIGPIDGHDIPTLCEAFDSAKMVDGPTVVHINTVKGKGYDFAEKNPDLYHGVSEFNVYTGQSSADDTNYSAEFGRLLMEFASKDRRICAVTAAMMLGTGLDKFFAAFPDRSFDVGIAEEHAVTFCSGLSAGGLIPVFAVYSTFFQRCVDQIIHDGALQRNKMIIAVDRAGFVGEDGETHQGIFDVSLIEGIPNTTVYSPATYSDLSRSLYNAFYKNENLVIVRYPRGRMPEDFNYECSGDDCEIIGETDADTAVVTYGREFFEVCRAYPELTGTGKKIKIIKLNRIKPLPSEAIEAALDCTDVYFFEEGTVGGGIGERFGLNLAEKEFKGRYLLTGINDEFVPHASVCSLISKYKLDSKSIIKIVSESNSDE